MKNKIAIFSSLTALVVLLINPILTFATSFTDTKKISNSGNDTVLPQLATDSSGYIHSVWMDVVENDWGWQNDGIFYSRWDGDVWSAPISISANTGFFAENPSVAVDSTNQVHVVYDDDTELGDYLTKIRYTKRNTDGSWTTPITLPHPVIDFDYAWNSQVAVDSSDTVHVIYVVHDNSSYGGSFYYTQNSGAGWSAPVLFGYDTDGATPLVNTTWGGLFADKNGRVHAVYWDWGQGIFYREYITGSWSTPVNITTADDIEFVRLTSDDNSNPFVAWFQSIDRSVRVRGRVSDVWQTEETLVTDAMRSYWGYPILGITAFSDNTIAAGWGEPGTGGTVDIIYKYNSGGGWSAPDNIKTSALNADSPWLFRDLWDNQHLVWTEKNASELWEIWYGAVQGTQSVIGAAGGTITSQIGSTTYATLNIPSGALTSDTEITIFIGPLPESVSPTVVTVPRAFTFGPSGTTFLSPVSAVINYTAEELAGGDVKTLKAYIWDSQTQGWAETAGTVNKGLKTLTANLNHFSLYGVAARAVNTEFLELSNRKVINSKATLPIKFNLTYKDDGTNLDDEDVTVAVKDSGRNYIGEAFTAKLAGESFMANVNFKTLEIEPGIYTLEVQRLEVPVGSVDIEITK